MSDPASITTIVSSIVAGVAGGWTAFNQVKNRHSGRHRDSKLDILTGELVQAKNELRKSNRSRRRMQKEMSARFVEIGSQLAAFNQSAWSLANRLEKLEEAVADLKRGVR